MPLTTKMKKIDKATGAESMVDVTVERDECNRPDTTLEGLAALKPVHMGGQQIAEGKYITAGNASQFADGASACVVMSEELAAKKGLKPLGIFRGFAVAGVEPDEMGIGPVAGGAAAAQAPRPEGRRHRSVGAERGLCQPDALLHGPARHHPTTSSMSMAAPFPSAIPMACPARA